MGCDKMQQLLAVERNEPLPPKPIRRELAGKHGQVIMLDPRRVKPLPDNPRRGANPGFSTESIGALARAIRATGQMAPAKVCLTTDPDYDAQLYDGERRQKACLAASVMLKAEVCEKVLDPEVLFIYSAASNFGKESHTCMEIAHMVDRLRKNGFTIEETADVFGKSTMWVVQHTNLLRLSPRVQEMLVPSFTDGSSDPVARPALSFQNGLLLVELTFGDQERLARKIVKHELGFAQARRLILKYRSDIGLEHKPRRGKASDPFATLGTLAERSEAMFGVYLDMKVRALREIAEKRGIAERRTLAEKLSDLGASITGLANTIYEAPRLDRR